MSKNTPSKRGRKPTLRTQDENAWGNQWVSNPRQERFVRLYMDPRSQTFGNAYQSAVKAGYKETYARIIVSKQIANKWVQEYKNLIQLEPQHIVAALQDEAMNRYTNRGSERIKALELLAKMNGMLVEKSVVAHVNIEQALNELK